MKLAEAFINLKLLAALENIERSLDADPDNKKVLNDLKMVSKELGINIKNLKDVQKVIYFFKNQESVY